MKKWSGLEYYSHLKMVLCSLRTFNKHLATPLATTQNTLTTVMSIPKTCFKDLIVTLKSIHSYFHSNQNTIDIQWIIQQNYHKRCLFAYEAGNRSPLRPVCTLLLQRKDKTQPQSCLVFWQHMCRTAHQKNALVACYPNITTQSRSVMPCYG